MVSNDCEKNLRVQEIAIENHVPIVYLVDSAGVFLQLQDQNFPDKKILVESLEIMQY